MRPHRLAQSIEVISAFHARDYPPGASFICPLLYDAGHLHKVFVAEEQLSQRITFVRVEPGGDDYQIRSEVGRDLFDRRFESAALVLCRGHRAQRNIQREAAAAAV